MEPGTNATTFKEFRGLEATHLALDEKLDSHQLALVRGGFDRAHRLFLEFRQALHAHIENEEAILLPLYEERVRPAPGGSGAPFRAEHTKLERMLESIDARLGRLEDLRHPSDGHDFIRVIEQEHELKRLWKAHSLRAQNILYPALDAATEPEEREWILARCRKNEESR